MRGAVVDFVRWRLAERRHRRAVKAREAALDDPGVGMVTKQGTLVWYRDGEWYARLDDGWERLYVPPSVPRGPFEAVEGWEE